MTAATLPMAPPAKEVTAPTKKIVVARSRRELEPFVEAWQRLARVAVEANAFAEPWFVLAALDHLETEGAPEIVLVLDEATADPVVGVFPLARKARWHGLPIPVLASLSHDYALLHTPLVHPEGAEETLDAFAAWVAASAGTSLLALERLTLDGPFFGRFASALRRAGLVLSLESCYSRALLDTQGRDPEAYVERALSGKRRKEMRRLEKRLRERGTLRGTVCSGNGDTLLWTKRFLELEASGWKGRENTALASNPASRRFFEELVLGAAKAGRLDMFALELDGRPIAMQVNLLAPPGSFAFKIAYDESLAAFSPGVHLEIANIAHVMGSPNVRWMDSCAVSDHFMINRLWSERRTLGTVLVSTGKPLSDLLVSAVPLARAAKKVLGRVTSKVPRERP